MGWIILAIVVIIVIAIISMYNGLVSARVKVDNAWSQIDVQLQRRFDLIPNFVETVKGYTSHESETFEKIAQLRTSWANAGTVAEKADPWETVLRRSPDCAGVSRCSCCRELPESSCADPYRDDTGRQPYNTAVRFAHYCAVL